MCTSFMGKLSSHVRFLWGLVDLNIKLRKNGGNVTLEIIDVGSLKLNVQ
jgi:hypothetical protein